MPNGRRGAPGEANLRLEVCGASIKQELAGEKKRSRECEQRLRQGAMELRDCHRALEDEESLCAERSMALQRQRRRLSRSVEWSELKEARLLFLFD